MSDERFEIVVTRQAANALSHQLPGPVAAAVIALITGPLLDDPRRVGKPLREPLDDIWSARRGTYRVLFRIDEKRWEVIVLRVAHRGDAYRSDSM